jgi:O-methyltransferase involved in polyketide biosynthesis
MIEVELGLVQETMLLTLWARAWDAQRKTPLLGDQRAVQLVQALDFDFSRFEGTLATRFGITVRAASLEAQVRNWLAHEPDALVVELGVGLSTRFDRLDNGRAHFLELDLPDVIALRRKLLAEGPRREFLQGSVLDDDFVTVVCARAQQRPILFVAEGLLPYLYEGHVRTLLRRLSEAFPAATLIFDTTSVAVVAAQQQLRTLKGTRARFAWGIQRPEDVLDMMDGGRLTHSESLRAMLEREQKQLPLAFRLSCALAKRLRPSVFEGYCVNVLTFGEVGSYRERSLSEQGSTEHANRPRLVQSS